MDSKLVSVVRDLESEAERILADARDQAAALRHQSERDSASLADERRAAAAREAEAILEQSSVRTQEEITQSRARQKADLDALLHRAEGRMENAVKLILDRLGKL